VATALYGGVGQRRTRVDIERDSLNDPQPSGGVVCQKQSCREETLRVAVKT